jgi:hypothetical protein
MDMLRVSSGAARSRISKKADGRRQLGFAYLSGQNLMNYRTSEDVTSYLLHSQSIWILSPSTLQTERKGHLQESILGLDDFRQVGVGAPALCFPGLPSLEEDADDGHAARDRQIRRCRGGMLQMLLERIDRQSTTLGENRIPQPLRQASLCRVPGVDYIRRFGFEPFLILIGIVIDINTECLGADELSEFLKVTGGLQFRNVLRAQPRS